jgi:hypothetical protein
MTKLPNISTLEDFAALNKKELMVFVTVRQFKEPLTSINPKKGRPEDVRCGARYLLCLSMAVPEIPVSAEISAFEQPALPMAF